MVEEEKTESSTDTEATGQVDAVESSETSNDIQEGVADSQPAEASQASVKPEEKKKVKKPKLKPNIKVQKIGHKKTQSVKGRGRGRKIEVIGHVISDKMDKTITVQIYRMVRHRRVGKYIKRSTKFKAHDEKNTARVGDQVLICGTRALSKTKYWKLSKVLRSSETV